MTAFKLALALVLCAALPLQGHEMETQRPKIVGLSHIALYVHDIERSTAFYRDVLGFRLLGSPVQPLQL